MRILTPNFDLKQFFTRVAQADRRALILDYDGTLAPFAVDRDRAYPHAGVREILKAFLTTDRTRLVLVSGRAVKDLTPLLGLDPPPEIWGSHGRERLMPDGTYEAAQIDDMASEGLTEAKTWISEGGLIDHLEEKPASLAVHTRGLEETAAREIHERVLQFWGVIAKRNGLEVHPFAGGIELRVPGVDKGSAVETILKEMGRGTAAAYAGDDLTDEDAFRAIKGRGLGILAREEFRSTAADLWLKPPEELLEFLNTWLMVSGGSR